MRGHSCKGQLSAIEETKRSSAIMWKSDQCCMPQCQNNCSKNIPNLTFLQFLSDESIQKQFLGKVVGLLRSLHRCIYNTYYGLVHLQITNSTRVCSVHFKEADFKKTLTGKRVLEKHAVPSMFCWSRSPRKRKSEKARTTPCTSAIIR